MKRGIQKNETIAIIGSADGPTSAFINNPKINLKIKIKNYLYKRKRSEAIKNIVASSHTLEELLQYAQNTYGATISNYKANAMPNISRVYEIKEGEDLLYIEIDDNAGTFGISFSGSKKTVKRFQAITKDLYTYYGVSEKDISEKSERYLSLLGVLIS